VKVTDAFKDAVAAVKEWSPLCREVKGKLVETDQEYAEVCFVPQGWPGRNMALITDSWLLERL